VSDDPRAVESTAIVHNGEAPPTERAIIRQPDELSVEAMIAQVDKIQRAMKAVMKDGVHFGVIPGTPKPTLYKPGAEKLCLLFRLDPQYQVERAFSPDGHLDVLVTCTLYHIPTGNRIASGVGSCSTRESRYAYRKAGRTCPDCGMEGAIIKGKAEYGGGWLCFKKKNGCGAKFSDGDAAIESQAEGRVDNEDIVDLHNTVVKMGCKRALVAAVLNGTAASDIFTQDVEDMPRPDAPKAPPARPAADPRTVISKDRAAKVDAFRVSLGMAALDSPHSDVATAELTNEQADDIGRWHVNRSKATPAPHVGSHAPEVPGDEASTAGAGEDNGLPFGDVHVPESLTVEQVERLAAAKARRARS
jgi:hypothetical protein